MLNVAVSELCAVIFRIVVAYIGSMVTTIILFPMSAVTIVFLRILRRICIPQLSLSVAQCGLWEAVVRIRANRICFLVNFTRGSWFGLLGLVV